jgi:hypothetical protein
MQQTKLIALLQTLSREEMKRLGDYVKSPYFNKREAPIALLKVLNDYHPDFENLKWEKIFKKTFPDKLTYSDIYLRNVLSDLYALAEDFLGQETLNNHPLLIANTTYQLLQRNLFKNVEQALTKMEKIEKAMIYDNSYPSSAVIHIYYIKLKKQYYERLEQRVKYSETQALLINIIIEYSIESMLLHFYEAHNDAKVYYNYHYKLDFFERFFSIIQKQDLEEMPPSISLLYRRLKLQVYPSWEAWHDLYNYGLSQEHKLTDIEKYLKNLSITNFLIQKKRENDNIPTKILEIEFQLYQQSINLRRQNGHAITGHLFENITSVALPIKGSEWVEQFIKENGPFLQTTIRQGLILYCQARLYFVIDDYEKTINILCQTPPFYDNYYFQVKILLILSYYKTENYESLTLALDAFTHTLKNHPELAAKHYNGYLNFLTIFRLLVRLKFKQDHSVIGQIRQHLQTDSLAVSELSWLIMQLNELETKQKNTIKTKPYPSKLNRQVSPNPTYYK